MSYGPHHGVQPALLLRGHVYVVAAAAVVSSACALGSGKSTTATSCPTRFAFVEPVRVVRMEGESNEAVRVAEEDIRAVLAESSDWRVARTASAADVVLRVEVEFWREGPLRNVGGTVWTRHPAKSEDTLISQNAATYDPNFGGPGPPTEFWETLLLPLLTVVTERCPQPNARAGAERPSRVPPQNTIAWRR